MGQHQGGGSGLQGGSGVGGVDGGLVARGHASVPAAVALLLLDAGVVPGLIARIPQVGQHVRPQALVLGSHEAGKVVAGLNLQRRKRRVLSRGKQSGCMKTRRGKTFLGL